MSDALHPTWVKTLTPFRNGSWHSRASRGLPRSDQRFMLRHCKGIALVPSLHRSQPLLLRCQCPWTPWIDPSHKAQSWRDVSAHGQFLQLWSRGTFQELEAVAYWLSPCSSDWFTGECVWMWHGELHGDTVTESRGSVCVTALVLTCKSPGACLVGHERQMIYWTWFLGEVGVLPCVVK